MDLMDVESRKAYPAVHILVQHGGFIAAIVAMLVPIAGLWFWLNGHTVLLLAGGIAGGLLVYLLMRSYVELVRIMADMLLPK